jgi:nitrite reductase/ring-hydroxylating ferredoxin subunit
MFQRIVFILVLIAFMSCENDDTRQNNPNLLNIQFSVELPLSLPQYSPLNFSGNAIYVGGQGIGNDGILVANIGSQILAWDASDPNMIPDSCTRLQVDGLSATNSCSNQNSYSLATGQPLQDGLQYPLLSYRVTETGDSIIVFN